MVVTIFINSCLIYFLNYKGDDGVVLCHNAGGRGTAVQMMNGLHGKIKYN